MQTGSAIWSVDQYPPKLAERWTRALIEKINRQIQERDISQFEKNATFLKQQIEYTPVAAIKAVFYQLRKSQIKMLILAKGSGESVVETISRSREAEVRSKPKRAVICALGTIAGFVLGVLIALMLVFRRKNQ